MERLLHVSQYARLRDPQAMANVVASKLVWSNAGYIAQIVESGRKISLRTTLRNAKSGEWDLTDESKHPIEAPEGTTFKHIETSGLGTEFAVVDNHGRVSVYSSLHLPLGRVAPSPMQSEDSKNLGSDLDAVVGLHWLAMYPNEFRVMRDAHRS